MSDAAHLDVLFHHYGYGAATTYVLGGRRDREGGRPLIVAWRYYKANEEALTARGGGIGEGSVS
ncbi:hypothetical protein [Methylocystis sp.]|uniref:hypothetical protein n=1 Tax=Methylocystis sp. TaxID=1911079 RepID=UPI003DA34441